VLALLMIASPASAAQPGGGYGPSPTPGRTQGPSPSPSAVTRQELPLTGTPIGLLLAGLGAVAGGAGLLWRTRTARHTVHKGR
jgi:hypothetical protein